MADIPAQLVKQLRDRTGAGMMDAKKALEESKGDIEQAIDLLRAKGLAKAAKKGDREARAGVIGIHCDGAQGVAVEINSETDFVARNERFQAFAGKVIDAAFAAGGRMDALLTKELEEELNVEIATIGERIAIGRADSVVVKTGAVIPYIHNKLGPRIGLIGVLLGIESSAAREKIIEIGDQLAMHIAAANPLFLDIASVSEDALDRERAVAKERALSSGKPEAIAEKMVEGAVRKYYEEAVLLEQAFFIDPAKKVKDVLKDISPDARIAKFVRYQIAG